MDRLLTVADAARILGVVPARVRQLANEGQLPPAATTLRGIRLFRQEDVEQLAEVREAKRNRTALTKGARGGGIENHG